ncbi:MAG: hypothetical protein HUJ73_05175, partial [Eubacterium sp.]|nr:hypothetical protein [Eubacterium sp.]
MADYDTEKWGNTTALALLDEFCAALEAVSAHTADVPVPERTASDLGAVGWSEEQLERITADYSAAGEEIERVYPLTPMQEGMLLSYLKDPDTTAYVLLSRFSLDFVPSEKTLREILERLAAKHEVFRTSVLYEGVDQPCQAVLKRKLGLKFYDVSEEADKEAAADRIHREELRAGFDLQRDPLFRLVLIRLSGIKSQLILCTHHIIVDGWSLSLYMDDVFGPLLGKESGPVSEKLKMTEKGRYEAYVRMLERFDRKTPLRYWKELLEGYEEKVTIPPVHPGRDGEAVKIEAGFVLDQEKMEQLRSLCAACGVTVNTAAELAWAMTLGVYNRTEDVVFGKVVSGRNRGNVSDVVGLFINTIPVRADLRKKRTVREALKALQDQAAESSPHDYCALTEIFSQTGWGSDLLGSIMAFENYEGTDRISDVLTGNDGIRPVQMEEELFNEVSVTAYLDEDACLAMMVTLDGKVYTESDAQTLIHLLEILLSGMTAAPDEKLNRIALVSEREQQALLKLGTGRQEPYDPEETF